MERLTYKLMTSEHKPRSVYNLTALGAEITCVDHCREHDSCGDCEVNKAINRLAAYEDTGLEPAEIAEGNERIKQIIRERFKELGQTLEEIPAGLDKHETATVMCELTEIYSRIFGISYDEAADELHKNKEVL